MTTFVKIQTSKHKTRTYMHDTTQKSKPIYIRNLKKGYKLAFSIWILLAILLFAFTITLSSLSYNKTYTAELNVQSSSKIGSTYFNEAKMHFKSNIFRVQENISTITILDISYKDALSKKDITSLTRHLQYMNFNTPLKLKGNIASITYKVSFLPLYKILALYFIAGLILIFIVSEAAFSFKQKILEFVSSPKFLQVFIISAVIYLIALSALLRGDVYYIDDLGRAIGSGDDWAGFSRYIARDLYAIINGFKGFPYTDISPLPQLFAALILSLSGMLISFIVRKKLDIVGIVATLPLGLSPYFLENLSYKFDAPLMSFSLLLILVPFLFKDNIKLFLYTSVVFLILSLSTYQASNGIYIVFTLLLVLLNYLYKEKSGKENLKFLGFAVLSFIVAMLVYKYAIATPVNGYVSSEAMSVTKILEGGYLKTYLSYVFSDLKGLPFFVFAIIVAILFIITNTLATKRNKALAFLASIVFLVLGLCFFAGAYLVLSKPLFAPRAFIGFGAFVTLVCIGLVYIQNFKWLKYISIVFVALLSYSLIVFANSYGNAITAQQNYMMMRASFVSKDLATLIPREMQPKVGVVLDGGIGYAPVASNFIKRYGGGIAKRLITGVFNQASFAFTKYPLIYQGTNYQDYYSTQCSKENTEAKKTLLLDNAFQSISKSGECYFVDLKPSTWQAQ
ncbi:glucosyltransferase domain-containing protein [Helicobacter sp. 11S02629-2]|uniref:glucosyltransferase domain-containing protein n=1 Tax=Helicobacter sp. 11S02629-2 TaxID=1476195 RepID=UPI000BCE7440|nr:glucosyltransferase domain-containing protein [Helicobacter sp. 11S02629-2]PAF46060.1 hypothetical protein BKH40_01235 [Helicobacter sp. 11S02629-2]